MKNKHKIIDVIIGGLLGALNIMSRATIKCCFWAIENVGIWSSIIMILFRYNVSFYKKDL